MPEDWTDVELGDLILIPMQEAMEWALLIFDRLLLRPSM
jgi:hypothetical protein